jgi:NAD(P)H-flavin reductase
LADREKFGKIVLLYGARTPKDILYSKELQRWRSRFDMVVDVTVDLAPKDWRGHVGVVTRLISRASFDPLNTLGLVCGPEVMMRYTVLELENQGLLPEQIYLSLERNMKCAIGFCGHCQLGPSFICLDGPVLRYDRLEPIFNKREV